MIFIMRMIATRILLLLPTLLLPAALAPLVVGSRTSRITAKRTHHGVHNKVPLLRLQATEGAKIVANGSTMTALSPLNVRESQRGRLRIKEAATFSATTSCCFNHPNSPFYTRTKIKTTTTSSTALHVKFKTFDEMLTHHRGPILIDFYAPWCGPCKMMKNELASIRSRLEEFGDDGGSDDDDNISNNDTTNGERESVKEEEDGPDAKGRGGIPVFHVNANKFPQVGAKNNIHGLPTLVLFHEGRELWRNEGIISGEEIMGIVKGFHEIGWRSLVLEGEQGQQEGAGDANAIVE